MQIGFLLPMHTALGSQGEGVQGSGTVGREGGVLIVSYTQKSTYSCTQHTQAGSESSYENN